MSTFGLPWKWRCQHSDFPGRKKRLEAGFSAFILIRVKSETLTEEGSNIFILTFLQKNTSCEGLTFAATTDWSLICSPTWIGILCGAYGCQDREASLSKRQNRASLLCSQEVALDTTSHRWAF